MDPRAAPDPLAAPPGIPALALESEAFRRDFTALIDEVRLDEAAALIDATFAGDPAAPVGRYARAVVATFRREFETAGRELRAVVASTPDFAAAHHDLGVLALWRGDLESSLASLRRALALDPANATYSIALAQSLFASGDYRAGWRHFEAREGGLARQPRPRGLWDGSPIAGSLAVLAEEGVGDVLQFCRYIAAVRGRAAAIYLVIDGQYATLAPLVRDLEGIDAVITDRRIGPPINAYCPIMTLAHLADASPANPMAVPYLRPPAERVEHWRRRLGSTNSRRVGLVWGGNPRSTARGADIDSRRSIDPALLGPLAEVPGIEWHSLQLGPAASQAGRLSPQFRLHDMTADLYDFAETAALIANLDLVITVDTSVVHVAGAIGAPTWMLNRFDSDWRWSLAGERTPWYPSLRVFRQRVFGDWSGAIASVHDALRRYDRPAPSRSPR